LSHLSSGDRTRVSWLLLVLIDWLITRRLGRNGDQECKADAAAPGNEDEPYSGEWIRGIRRFSFGACDVPVR
jgi:hypothetical protein